MRNLVLGLVLAVVAASGCTRTGDDEYQVEVPDIDVSRDTLNVRLPDVNLPDVDVDIRRDSVRDTLRRDTTRDTAR